jgi:hypothetical protein
MIYRSDYDSVAYLRLNILDLPSMLLGSVPGSANLGMMHCEEIESHAKRSKTN